jgi:hypothetical protein
MWLQAIACNRYRGPTVGEAERLLQVRVGVISNTHGLVHPEAEGHLAGVAHIVHAGDIGRPDVIAGLRRIVPVIALRGNVDIGSWAQRYPGTRMVRLGGRSIYVLHDIHELKLDPISSGIDVVIPGHSDRDDSRRALSQSRQPGATAFQLARHSGDTGADQKRP